MKMNRLMKVMLSDETKVTQLNDRRLQQLTRVRLSYDKVKHMQDLLYQATVKHERKVKTFKLLDQMKAEFVFTLKEQNAQAAKRNKKPSNKKTMADIMTCLASLPEAQRLAVINTMQEKQKKEHTE